jgi:hypothetical protein
MEGQTACRYSRAAGQGREGTGPLFGVVVVVVVARIRKLRTSRSASQCRHGAAQGFKLVSIACVSEKVDVHPRGSCLLSAVKSFQSGRMNHGSISVCSLHRAETPAALGFHKVVAGDDHDIDLERTRVQYCQ